MLRAAINHRKFGRLAEALGITRFAAIGLAECLWHLTATQAPQGDIGKLSDAEIAAGVFWPKRTASRLVQALMSPEVRLLDSCNCHRIRVHDWNCHADQSVKKTLTKNRKRFLPCYLPDPRSVMVPESFRNGSGLPVPEPVPEPEPEPVRAHAEPPMPIPPGVRDDADIDRANAIHAEIRGGVCAFVHDLIPVFRSYPETWADGWRRFLESQRGKPRASPREFAGNAKHWCEPQRDAVAEFLAQGMVLGRSA